jgi:hypothetical protein
VNACYVAAIQQRLPAVEVPQMRLAPHGASKSLQVAKGIREGMR